VDDRGFAVKQRYWLHALLFVATCGTTYMAGGPIFAATLMSILLAHEMGHYVVARRHGVDASLPYFIPVPFVMTGTMGAIIKMRAPIDRRDALIDVGAAGPLAGLCVAIPLLAWGLADSPVGAVTVGDGGFTEGNSILYALMKLAIKGRWLPGGGVDVQLGPMAMAAWVGLLVTFINLMPIGQLDGGHVAYAFFGAEHEDRSRWLHRGLLGVGTGVLVALALEAHRAGRDLGGAVSYGAMSALPWGVWALMLLGMRRMAGGMYHPPVGPEPMAPSRRALFWLVATIFVLIFTPVPMRETLP
jgi:membrane-associated protease RseP (regulator of RpoE activity)